MLKLDKFTSQGKKIFNEIEKLKKAEVHVGYQKSHDFEDDGTDVLDVAMWNEVGTENTPARPFMRQSADKIATRKKAMWQSQIQQIVSKGKTAEQALNTVGSIAKGVIQDTIRNGDFVKNAPSTVAKKGSSQPLIDTGLMRRSVHFTIEED